MEGIAESRIAIEVSTAGLRKPVGEIYPDRALLEWCLECGCPVALSSDGTLIAYASSKRMLADLGVEHLSVFDHRRRSLEPLGEP